jgi:hypothetical protein
LPWWRRLPTLANLDFRILGIGLSLVLCLTLAIYGVFFGLLEKGSTKVPGGASARTDVQPGSASSSLGQPPRKTGASRDARVQVVYDLFQSLPVEQLVKDLQLGSQQETQVRAVFDSWKFLENNRATADDFARLSREHARMVGSLNESQKARLRSTLEARLARLPNRAGSSPADRKAVLDRLFAEPKAR